MLLSSPRVLGLPRIGKACRSLRPRPDTELIGLILRRQASWTSTKAPRTTASPSAQRGEPAGEAHRAAGGRDNAVTLPLASQATATGAHARSGNAVRMARVNLGYRNDILVAMDVLIRDLPEEVHTELASRAAANDMSLRAYLREVLTQHVAVPSMDEWLRRVRNLGPVPGGGQTGADLVAAARADDDQLVGR